MVSRAPELGQPRVSTGLIGQAGQCDQYAFNVKSNASSRLPPTLNIQ